MPDQVIGLVIHRIFAGGISIRVLGTEPPAYAMLTQRNAELRLQDDKTKRLVAKVCVLMFGRRNGDYVSQLAIIDGRNNVEMRKELVREGDVFEIRIPIPPGALN